jgi:hypothetical protein|tara:strand:- start:570 stop:779 length:210 start_codon:yes stop_codon:yes gene_type:complete
MAFGTETKPHIGSDFTINQYENASENYEKTDTDQVPFSLGLSGVLPFNIGSTVSKSAYTMTKGKQVSTE